MAEAALKGMTVDEFLRWEDGTNTPYQLPGGFERAADVVATVDQDAGNAMQCRGITLQLVLPEEGGVPPVVRDQAREPEAKVRVVVARIREMAGGEGDVRIFPGAPLPRRVIANGGIGVKQ